MGCGLELAIRGMADDSPDEKPAPGPDQDGLVFAAQEEPDHLTPEEEEDLTSAEADSESVVYSGQDFDVNGLVRRLRKQDIRRPTGRPRELAGPRAVG